MHPLARETLTECATLLRLAGAEARRRARPLALWAAALAALALLLWPRDADLSDSLAGRPKTAAWQVADKFRRWGDFRDTTAICAAVWLAGLALRRRDLRTVALATFTAACVAGLAVNVVRFASGRPRPKTVERQGVADGFYGPTLNHRFQSFPSGHSTTSLACATALFVASPPLGAPALLSASGVVWACLHTRNHYVTDVVVGGGAGIAVGALFGAVARRRRRALQTPPARAP